MNIMRILRLVRAKIMLGCKWFPWTRVGGLLDQQPRTFSLPAPIPQWPQGTGFGTGTIRLGELEVCEIVNFEFIWGSNLSSYGGGGWQGVSFYKPTSLPQGFFNLGYYAQPNSKPLRGFVLAAREVSKPNNIKCLPALRNPEEYTLVWCSNDGNEYDFDGPSGFFWLPQPPEGYKSLGFVVTNKPAKPELSEVKCVRNDLTDMCETHRVMLKTYSKFSQTPILVWTTRPCHRGMHGRGVSVGTFFCSEYLSSREELGIVCLKNYDPNLHAMPNLDQIHSLIRHYGPTVFFHPDEVYLPSSVSWFFENGALLFKKGDVRGETIDPEGYNLPAGGTNDGEYWIDLPNVNPRVKHGDIGSAKLYVHVKPALGGTFTDIAMWVFCPFNGAATLKVGVLSFGMGKVGQHLGDWEHFTLRVSNFTGELQSIYFSQHSGGKWVNAHDIEFREGNKAVVYSSKHGHASYPRPGTYIQGSSALGVGIRNDAARSNYCVDSSVSYEVVAAEYLGDGVVREPGWLQYMREWGPTIVYDSRNEVDRIIRRLPMSLRCTVQNVVNKLPVELGGEAGPTGPKEKDNWVGDERW